MRRALAQDAYPSRPLRVIVPHAAAALASPELQKKLVEQGDIPSPGTPDAFRALIVADSKKFAQIKRELLFPLTRRMIVCDVACWINR